MSAHREPEAAGTASPAGSSGAGLVGRHAIVTGAGRGIGRAIAALLCERGVRVSAIDIDDDAVHDAADEIGSRGGGEILARVADLAEEASVAGAVAAAVERSGGLDIVINNAAISAPSNPPITELELVTWSRVLAVNLTGAMLLCKHAVPHLRSAAEARGGAGAIVNIASTRALQSEPDTEAYAASKGGLVALSHALAISLGPAIRVNCISPGWIDTSAWQVRDQRRPPDLSAGDHAQHPVGRVGRPEDIAELCAWLVSDAAGFVTGQNFVVDGGMTRKMIYEE